MRPIPALAALACCALLAACEGSKVPQPRLTGVILDGAIDETSGLASSTHHGDTLWLLQDGGNGAFLHAISRRGSRIATVRIAGARNTDWEDLDSFEYLDRHWLLIADTGDNGGLRRTAQLHVVAEPDPIRDGATLRPSWSIAFRWPDGPRDCEAVAVDARAGEVLLISKKRKPAQLFSVPLRPARGVVVARRIGTLAEAPAPTTGDARRDALGRQITGADLSPDGRTLAVLTYDRLLLYTRSPGEPWARAVARMPAAQPLPWLHQAEAIAWAPDGKGLIATGEFSPAPLVWLPASR
ncbi:putative integral membrane protein [Lysobacter dokdonensis DS-58]|uniref:Putative integral membrane protein n=1 Tax=Lysobacter dokdonensis DS-58 TaxID=1300345 RepID=A0A0A2WLW4_9GAMM|nr:hypothetical protein [Lysobacter dokdonensis]KGQ19697.1 putative integral membrane protein [Lysobacter dokdonensis DS-58]